MTSTSSVSSTSSSTATTSSSTSSTSSTSSSTTTDGATIGSQLLTSLGVGTGIDMTTMATNIATATYASQNDALNTQLSKVQVQISEASQLKSDLLTFSSSLSSLIDGGGLLPSPSVANSSVATASLPLGSSGASASYSLEVSQLAQSQVLASGNLSSSATMNGGTLTFNFGTISNGSFSSNGASSAAVTIPDGASLTQVASAINSANIGVSAYVATNTNGSQLVFKGTQGAAQGFTISSSDTGSSGTSSLSALAYDPASSSNATTLVQGSTDAAYKLDGIARTSTSNTITNAAAGLSLTLTGTNAGNPTTITYSDPSSSIKTTMSNLVDTLNSLVTEMNTDTSASTGQLYNDSGARAMSRAFSQLAGATIMPNATGTDPKRLTDLGVSVNKDGSFSLDTTKLASILSTNASGVAAMFTKGLNGIYSTVFNTVSSLTSSTDPGSLAGSVTRYTKQQTSLTAQQTTIASQQAALRTQLISSLGTANTAVANSNSTLTFLKNQIAAWNKTSN